MYRNIFILFSLTFCFTLTANDTNNVLISKKSLQDIYQSKLVCNDSLSSGSFQNCWLTLSRSNQLVKDVEIFIDGGMPAHGHGLPTAPKVVWSEEKKVHLIKGLKFSMPGQWALNFKVNAKDDALKDQIKILIEVD